MTECYTFLSNAESNEKRTIFKIWNKISLQAEIEASLRLGDDQAISHYSRMNIHQNNLILHTSCVRTSSPAMKNGKLEINVTGIFGIRVCILGRLCCQHQFRGRPCTRVSSRERRRRDYIFRSHDWRKQTEKIELETEWRHKIE